ncbi:MAG: gliding motility-associated C-terminal domain-containing protein [Bacteroidetes bacterium]|nr:gliding motility-associated C-terminal domain-containing protein [Bacteroidota bacterium]
MNAKLLGLLICLFWLSGSRLQASHNLAGQIIATRLAPNVYELVLTTYTDPFAAGVDRCTAVIEVFNRDGSSNLDPVLTTAPIPRENGPMLSIYCNGQIPSGIFIVPGIKKNIYRTVVTLPGPGFYVFRYFDVARQNNVRNMDRPGETAFFVETMVLNSPLDPNSNPRLLNDPLEEACTDRLYTHNPGAFDPNGDSLVFSLINCQQYEPPNIPRPLSVNNYRYPNEFGGRFTIDRSTGLVSWDTPQQLGTYNISILVEEYRRGRLIGYVIRDMAIIVRPCTNHPPIFNPEIPTDTCVTAGQLLEFDIKTRDPDESAGGMPFNRDSVYFYLNNAGEGFNGPFQETPPAQLDFYFPFSSTRVPVTSFPVRYRNPTAADPANPFDNPPPNPPNTNPDMIFSWTPGCAQVRRQFYQLDIQAHDNFGLNPELYAHHIVKINVVAPPVENLVTAPGPRAILLNWDAHACASFLQGYDIYRANDSIAYTDTVCCDAVPAGYTRVGSVSGGNTTTFLDDNNGQGLAFTSRYCYRVVAVFQNGMTACPSEAACERIQRSMPVILIDSVETTDAANGRMRISWQLPDYSQINTSFFPPPYTYRIERQAGFGGTGPGNLVYTTLHNPVTGSPLPDTTFLDGGLNTEMQPYTYRVYMTDATGNPVEHSEPASSIYLTTVGQQSAIRLIWREQVPWRNHAYDIYRRNPGQPGFAFVTTVPATQFGAGIHQHTYLDEDPELDDTPGADNTYCYYILGRGSYLQPGITEPLLNASEIRCDQPRDTIPPCLPGQDSITVSGQCEDKAILFSWGDPDFECASDLASWQVYYSEAPDQPLQLIFTSNDPALRSYTYTQSGFDGLSGCFYLSATDTRGNESNPAPPLCIDKCPVILLPNVFTPNGDGFNDLFVPIRYRAIRTLRIEIFNRWGNLVYTSSDINKLWDGTTTSGQEATAGHYFFVLDFTLDNFEQTRLKRSGGITLLR